MSAADDQDPRAPAGANLNTNRKARGPRPARPRSEPLISGRLIEHGAANYQFRRDQDPSYYVKLLTMRGERVLWGKDLERAIKASATAVASGDVVGVQRLARETVTVTERRRDNNGQVVSEREQLAHRTRWVVEKAGYFAERARLARRVRDEHLDARQAVRERPELKSTFLTLRAAQEFANARIAEPQDRARFLALIKGAMVGSIHKGEPLPTVRMKTQPVRTEEKTASAKTMQDRERTR